MASFHSIQSRRIYESIVSQIKRSIDDGHFSPGDQLPSERELAEMFGVGRTSVREALRTLEAEGLIVTRQGQGTFISHKESNCFAEHFAELLMQNECTPLHILEARTGIEVHMARLAAKKREDEHLIQLSSFLDKMEDLIRQGKPPTEPDQAFHLVIAEASQNIILRDLFENILDLMQRSMWLEAKEAVLEDSLVTNKYLEQHQTIYAAIRDQRPEDAAAHMHTHLKAIYEDQLAMRGSVEEMGF